jgi:hypothetical protein
MSTDSIWQTYKPNPKLDPARLPKLCEQFAQAFASLPNLLSILGSLSIPRPFSSIVTENTHRATWIDALVWLLGTDVVVELRTYLRIAVSPQIKVKAREGRGTTPDAPPDEGLSPSLRPASLPTGTATGQKSNAPLATADFSQHAISSPSSHIRALGRELSGQMSGISLRTDTTAQTSSSDDAAAESASVIAEPGQPTAKERQWLAHIMAGKPAPAQELFDRFFRLFMGRAESDRGATGWCRT